MRAARPLLLSLVAAALAVAGCQWLTGPDCGAACDKVASCKGLTGTFYLSCNSFLGDCYDSVASCASCIDRSSTTCGTLTDGGCDPACLVPTPDAAVGDAGP